MSHNSHRQTHDRPITDATFPFDMLRSDRPVLVDSSADWFGACQRLAPVLARLTVTAPPTWRRAARLAVVAAHIGVLTATVLTERCRTSVGPDCH